MVKLSMLKQGLNDLPDSISELQDMVVKLHQEIDFLKSENAFIREELRLQRLKMYTRISERFQDETDNLQRLLFEDFSKDEKEPDKRKKQ
jgi:regulator of replication initiation timing